MVVMWYILIVIGIVGIALISFLISNRFIQKEEKRLYKNAGAKLLLLKNEGVSVDKICEDIEKINKNKPINFNIRGRL